MKQDTARVRICEAREALHTLEGLTGQSFRRFDEIVGRFELFLQRGFDIELLSEVTLAHIEQFVTAKSAEGPPSISTQHLRRSVLRVLFRVAHNVLTIDRGAKEDKKELVLQTAEVQADGSFKPTAKWRCEGVEIDGLHAFLGERFLSSGEYELTPTTGEGYRLLEHLRSGKVSADFLFALSQTIIESISASSNDAELEALKLIGSVAEVRRRERVIEELNGLVGSQTTSERELHKLLNNNWWLFGSEYVGKVPRQQLTVLDEYDIPLLRADGVLHIVELKKAYVPKAVIPWRNHYAVSDAVATAVNQAMNYLRSADEQRATIKVDLGVECRRAKATVVVGHPRHNKHDKVDEEAFRETIRTYNSHLSRIEVLTYEDILRTARFSVTALSLNPPK